MSGHQPIDLSQLARYTGGEARLDAEVLELFARQSALAVSRLETLLEGGDGRAWRETAHSLKGSALAVGAGGLAQTAAFAEGLDPASAPAEAADTVRALKAHSRSVAAFIQRCLAD